jgi:hypothetical protein
MYAIASPLKPDDSGDPVANLQTALLLLLKQEAFKSFDPPRNPRADKLKALTEDLRTEQVSQSFGLATKQLLVYLQLREGHWAFLDGQVEETTAQRLNEWLAQLGVFYRVQGRVSEVGGAVQTSVRLG